MRVLFDWGTGDEFKACGAHMAGTMKNAAASRRRRRRRTKLDVLVGFFYWSDDHGGVAWLAGFALSAILAWLTWSAGWAWHWYWHGHWGWSSNRHFNRWGYHGWCWVNGGFFAGGQGGDSQQCGTQSGDFHGGFLL